MLAVSQHREFWERAAEGNGPKMHKSAQVCTMVIPGVGLGDGVLDGDVVTDVVTDRVGEGTGFILTPAGDPYM